MAANLFDNFDEIATGPEGRPLWAARAPYRPHERYDLMLVPRVKGWEEDAEGLAALERIERQPFVEAVDRDGNQVWVRLSDDRVGGRGKAPLAGEAADHWISPPAAPSRSTSGTPTRPRPCTSA